MQYYVILSENLIQEFYVPYGQLDRLQKLTSNNFEHFKLFFSWSFACFELSRSLTMEFSDMGPTL